MNLARWLIGAVLVVLLGVPLLARRSEDGGGDAARRLVILSPHNEQIRSELGRGFSRWHEVNFGEPAIVAWSTPGGTSEIRKMLIASTEAALRDGRPIGGNADLLFGGGSYEFKQLSKPVSVEVVEMVDGEERTVERTGSILEPVEIPVAMLEEVYGDGRIGDERLFDEQGSWFGVALSGFGIVYNRQVLAELGVPEPSVWADLADPRLRRWVVLANPGQSGSVATAMEAILQRRGWDEGWAILRRMAANSRSFVSSAAKAPIDVSSGDAAAGLCIDFYGRYQAQSLRDAALAIDEPELDRLGYVDPPGQTVIDPDPIAMLTGAPDPELAKRFIEYCLSLEGQALWQFRAGTSADPASGAPAGPERFELRRMPVRRGLYATFADRMVDQVDPWTVASAVPDPDSSMRSFIAPIFAAAAMDRAPLLQAAWTAIVEHPAYPAGGGLVRSTDVDDPTLAAMLARFDAMPEFPAPDGRELGLADRAARGEVRQGWLRGGWKDAGLWPADAAPASEFRRRAGEFFEAQYLEVLRLASEGSAG
ncbi:MAG: ABC transporter substrate-binding protein [Phycisphaerales bacterium]